MSSPGSSWLSEWQCLAQWNLQWNLANDPTLAYRAAVAKTNVGQPINEFVPHLNESQRALLDARTALRAGQLAESEKLLETLSPDSDAYALGDQSFLQSFVEFRKRRPEAATQLLTRAAELYATAGQHYCALRARINAEIAADSYDSHFTGNLRSYEVLAFERGLSSLLGLIARSRAMHLMDRGAWASADDELQRAHHFFTVDGCPEDALITRWLQGIVQACLGKSVEARVRLNSPIPGAGTKANYYRAILSALVEGKDPTPLAQSGPLAKVEWPLANATRRRTKPEELIELLESGDGKSKYELIEALWPTDASAQVEHRLHTVITDARKKHGAQIVFDLGRYRLIQSAN